MKNEKKIAYRSSHRWPLTLTLNTFVRRNHLMLIVNDKIITKISQSMIHIPFYRKNLYIVTIT